MKGVRLLLAIYILTVLVTTGLAILAYKDKIYYEFWIWGVFLIILIAFPLFYFKKTGKKKEVKKKPSRKKVPKSSKKKVSQLRISIESIIKKIKDLFKKKKKEELKAAEEAPKKAELSKAAAKGKPKQNIKQEKIQKKKIKLYEKEPEPEQPMPQAKPGPLEFIELNKPREKAETKSSTVKTDFDRIIDFLKGKKEVPFDVIAKNFNLTHEKVEEWAKIMADHGLVEIVYPTFGDAKMKLKEEAKNAQA